MLPDYNFLVLFSFKSVQLTVLLNRQASQMGDSYVEHPGVNGYSAIGSDGNR